RFSGSVKDNDYANDESSPADKGSAHRRYRHTWAYQADTDQSLTNIGPVCVSHPIGQSEDTTAVKLGRQAAGEAHSGSAASHAAPGSWSVPAAKAGTAAKTAAKAGPAQTKITTWAIATKPKASRTKIAARSIATEAKAP